MSIADWFKPKWKHSKPAVRLAAVEELTDQNVLARISRNDEDREAREAALKRVTDQRVSADIVTESFIAILESGGVKQKVGATNDNGADGKVACRSRLGGLLNFYYREAA